MGDAALVPVGVVVVVDPPGVPTGLAAGLGGQHPAAVVDVGVDDAGGAGVVVRGHARRQAVGGVAPALVAVGVGELQRRDAVAGVVGANDLAGSASAGIDRSKQQGPHRCGPFHFQDQK